MNRVQPQAVEAKMMPAMVPSPGMVGKRNKQDDDITAWFEMQEDAEMNLITHNLTGRQNREYRRSLHD